MSGRERPRDDYPSERDPRAGAGRRERGGDRERERERDTRDVRDTRDTRNRRRDPREDLMDTEMDMDPEPVIVRDPRTGRMVEVYPSPSPAMGRGEPAPAPRGEDRHRRDRDDRDLVSSRHQIIDANMDPPSQPLPGRDREFFIPGDGIEREVLQYEITRYLGQDATVRPGRADGRNGYLIKAYRAPTTEMIRSLKEDSARFQREQEKKARDGRGSVQYIRSNAVIVRDRQQERSGGGMDIDDDDDMPTRSHGRDYDDLRDRGGRDIQDSRDPRERGGRHGGRDPRDLQDARDLQPIRGDPRGAPVPTGRHALPVSTGYTDPSYPATEYALQSNQPGYGYDPNSQPRTGFTNNTPPPLAGRGGQPIYSQAYSQAGYPAVAAPQAGPTQYIDPRTGRTILVPAGAGYPQEPASRRDRHR